MNIISWKIDPALARELDTHYKATLAKDYVSRTPEECIQTFTFDEAAPALTLLEAGKFLAYINKNFLRGKLQGIGVEVGAGPGTWSGLIANLPDVEKVYAVEGCSPIAKLLMPIVVPAVAHGTESKVVGCVGDFTHLEIDGGSTQFVFDFFSLHHAADLKETIRELYRVLGPGGFVFCFDKARPDSLTESDINRLLDTEYTDESKKQMGVLPTTYHTRRMNGEREYRLGEWREAFVGAGFSKFEHFNIARPRSRRSVVAKLKKMFSMLPPRLQAIITSFVISPNPKKVMISADHRIYTPLVNHFPKEISLMIAWK